MLTTTAMREVEPGRIPAAHTGPDASRRLLPDRLFNLHLFTIGVLAAAHIALLLMSTLTGHDNLMGLNRLFNLNAEGNLPTFFVGVALMAAALAAALIAQQARHTAQPTVQGWWIVAACLAFLALDDVSQIHEMIGGLVRRLAFVGSRSSPWIILYAPLAAVIATACIPLWRQLPAPTRVGLAVAGILYLGAELGLELIEVALVDRLGSPVLAGQSMTYKVLVTIEEVLGMVAVALLLRTFLVHFTSNGGSIIITWADSNRDEHHPGGA